MRKDKSEVGIQLTILAIDPGVNTGVALFNGLWQGSMQKYLKNSFDTSVTLEMSNPFEEYEVARDICDMIIAHKPCKVVIEDFVLHSGSKSAARHGISPVRITSSSRTLSISLGEQTAHAEWSYQMSSVAKTPGNRRTLEKSGLLKGEAVLSSKHERDAMLHAIAYIRNNESVLDHLFSQASDGF